MAERPGCGSRVQTLIFPKAEFTATEARAWAREHGFLTPAIDRGSVKRPTLRLRQFDPAACAAGRLRTIPFGQSGIKAVVCPPTSCARPAGRPVGGLGVPLGVVFHPGDRVRWRGSHGWYEGTFVQLDAPSGPFAYAEPSSAVVRRTDGFDVAVPLAQLRRASTSRSVFSAFAAAPKQVTKAMVEAGFKQRGWELGRDPAWKERRWSGDGLYLTHYTHNSPSRTAYRPDDYFEVMWYTGDPRRYREWARVATLPEALALLNAKAPGVAAVLAAERGQQ